MKSICLLFLLISYYAINAQPVQTIQLADNLLKPGNYKAAIISYEFPPEIVKLQDTALAALKRNPEWANKHVVTMVKRGDTGIPNMDIYGLTKEEFKTMVAGFREKKKAIAGETFNFIIKKDKNSITFSSTGKLSAFNYLTIDIRLFISTLTL